MHDEKSSEPAKQSHEDGQIDDENVHNVCISQDFEVSARSIRLMIIKRKTTPEEPADQAPDSSSDAAAEEAFKKFYLRKITEELAEDLDQARSAPDFSERSLPILIEALQQGVGTFSRDERIRIGRIGLGVDRS